MNINIKKAIVIFILTPLLLLPVVFITCTSSSEISGIVFEDSNQNGTRDSDEAGIPGVIVSNGINVVGTNENGDILLFSTNNAFQYTNSFYSTDDEDILTRENANKYLDIFEALSFCLKEYYSLVGIKKNQIHISGGIDSAVAAAIAAYSMGKENCVFITNPTEYNGEETKGFAEHIANTLEVPLIWNPTGEIYDKVVEEHEKAFGDEPTPTGKASIQAVSRAVQGLAASHTFGSGIIACGNHTEIVPVFS